MDLRTIQFRPLPQNPEDRSAGPPEEDACSPPGTLGVPGSGYPDWRWGAAWSPAQTRCRAQASPAVPGRQRRCCWTQYGSLGTPYGRGPGRGVGRRQDAEPPHPLLPPLSITGSSLGGRWRMGWPASQGSETMPLPVTSGGLSPRWFSSSTSPCPHPRPTLSLPDPFQAQPPPVLRGQAADRCHPSPSKLPGQMRVGFGESRWQNRKEKGRSGGGRGPLHWRRGEDTAW